MTQDGRPSPLMDIRYFRDGPGNGFPHHPSTAFGRQVALLLNAQGVSAGAFNSLYINMTRALPEGATRLRPGDGVHWWFRYLDVGITADLPENTPDVPEAVVRATVTALTVVVPDRADDIRAAAGIARTEGRDIRFVVREKDHARVRLRIATTIPAHPVPSDQIVLVEDRATRRQVELPPIRSGWYFEAFRNARLVRLSDMVLTGLGTDAFSADWSAAYMAGRADVRPRHPGPIPPYTALVRRHF